MATSTSLAEAAALTRSAPHRNPLVLWHLLSLDAPSVAALWTWFLAASDHVMIPSTTVVAMALAVWILYVADRLLDSRPAAARHDLEARHYFHRAHRRAFVFGLVAASLALAPLIPQLAKPSLHLYLTLGALLSGYFLLVHSAATNDGARRLPKELAVGIFFSAASFIPTISRQPGLRLSLLPGALLFAVLCSLNCLFIYAWEHPVSSPRTHPATRAVLGTLPAAATVVAIFATALFLFDRSLPWRISLCLALSALLLLCLHATRRIFAAGTLRAAADLCLLTPVLFLLTPILFLPRLWR